MEVVTSSANLIEQVPTEAGRVLASSDSNSLEKSLQLNHATEIS